MAKWQPMYQSCFSLGKLERDGWLTAASVGYTEAFQLVVGVVILANAVR